MTAVALRAHYQIGLLSKGLDVIGHRPQKGSTDGPLSKNATLKAAGISETSAKRDQKLTEIITLDECERLCRERAS